MDEPMSQPPNATAVVEPWERVLTRSTDRPLTFDIVERSADGRNVHIKNTDGTTTAVIGRGLALEDGQTSGKLKFEHGVITALQRISADGRVVDRIANLEAPVAGAPSFGSPPLGASGLEWALSASLDRGRGKVDDHVGGRQLRGGVVSLRTFAAVAAPLVLVVGAAIWMTGDPVEAERARLKSKFALPTVVPYPNSNVPSAAKAALGERLFNDKRLSVDGTVSCVTCHDAAKGFSDGVALGRGVAGTPVKFHSPTLWNLAWGNAFFWDGRLATLEAQAVAPIENPEEMGSSIAPVIEKLKSDVVVQAAFRAAFPEQPEINKETLAKSLATYMRSLVSPPTRFDAWIAGRPDALTASEKSGFAIFVGKGGCMNCHSGWAFTDYAFHDIGLPSQDRGRGFVIGRPMLNQAFKTPTLRELTWSAPYMHDGSLKTLEDVVRHYETGGVNRSTRSPDMPKQLPLTDNERRDLVAFLRTLSSPTPPRPADPAMVAVAKGSVPPAPPRVGQRSKQFSHDTVRIVAGQTLSIFNDDTQAHNVFVQDPRMNFDSGWQQPGEQTQVPFEVPGDFQVFCGIHPNMRLTVQVEPQK
jgi:cytochrome c peroxidase